MRKFQCYMPIVNTVVVDDINICVIYRIKVVLLNNERMESQTTTYAYEAPAGRKYISQILKISLIINNSTMQYAQLETFYILLTTSNRHYAELSL